MIIILTQGLFRFCIVEPFLNLGNVNPAFNYFQFGLLVLSTLLIAGGGYIINDFFDRGADQINKPNDVLVGRMISLRAVKHYYWILTITGIIIGFYLAISVQYYLLGFIFPIVAILLWYYSSQYQKTVLVGNILIAIMSGLVVIIVWIFELFALLAEPLKYVEVMGSIKITGWIALAYTLFAFLLSLVREVLKDAEDVEGDRESGFRTMAIVHGFRWVRGVAAGIEIIVIGLLALSQFLLFQYDYTLVFWYLLIAVQTLLLYLLYHTFLASKKEDFHFLSNVAKMIMLAGILSMQLFYISL
ncbi:MAG: geranylgeranylglycerol-phosphate geranylgeranyltransferase [Bacteroidetes bacterium]|nr:geranylgeranylglycerol-phosphate geranylgeranyltransferase [Bacteroidota bacterium]